MSNYKFEGWHSFDNNAIGNMKWQEFKSKTWTEDDVDIAISHCGICASDVLFIRIPWAADPYPCVVGHEIIGKAVRVGENVTHVKEGDRVGVGAQANSCLKPDCWACADGMENHCVNPEHVGTYGSNFVFSIPEKLPSHEAAPMLCAGVTVYSPLKRHGAGPGRTVGVVGLGGLGHFAVLFAKALGADKVVVISRSNSKKDDAMKIGADDFVATGEDKGWDAPSGRLANSLDLIVSTVSSPDMPLSGYLNLLRFEGTFVQVGASMEPMPGVAAFSIIPKRAKITGSLIGSREEINEMLQLAADKGIKPWVEQRPMEDANAALEDMEHGLARYRYCLVNERYST